MLANENDKQEILGLLSPGQGRKTCIAVVGASSRPEKYGNIIVHNLKAKGFTIWPVNPREKVIADLEVYPGLDQLPGRPGIINVVTPPPVSLLVLEEAARLGFPNIWFQEGSFDDRVLERLGELPILGINDACIMVIAAQAGGAE